MNLYIYSDESGVFDAKHNKYFVFGGLICMGNDERDLASRKYAHVERVMYENGKSGELKANNIGLQNKKKVYRSLKYLRRFAVIIDEKKVNPEIFKNKRHKQRYLDFAYKIVLKKCLQYLQEQAIIKDHVSDIYIYCDEHTTSTDAVYELREALLSEFKNGTFNSNYDCFYEPIFKNLNTVQVFYCDSKSKRLVRAADIIANTFYHKAIENRGIIEPERNAFVLYMPECKIASCGDEFCLLEQEMQSSSQANI